MKIKYLAFIITLLFTLKNSAQVTADFSSNTNSGCPNPLLIIVSDISTTSSGTINFWNWEITGPPGFVNVTSSTNQVSTSLSIPGFYSVSLEVCNGNGICDTLIQTNYIEVFESPTFTYNITPIQGCTPQEICFDLDIDPGCGTTTSVLFDVNDGIVYNVDSFCHTYSAAGTYYDFTFSTQNSCGCVLTETIGDTVSVAENPIASFIADQTFSCTPPMNVTFTNTSTASSNANYLWNIPGEVNNATTTNLNHSFGVGNYDVELIVTEPEGCTDTILYNNMISVGNPVADFDSDLIEICEGSSVQFNDSSNGSPTGWLWEVIGTAISSSSQNPIITFPNAGVFDIRLTVLYAGGCLDVVDKLAYVTVNSLPVNSFTVSDSGSCVLPFSTIYNSTSTNSVNSVWSFPGGSPSTAIGSGPFNVTYTNYGNYNITLSDTSADGCFEQTTFNNVVSLVGLQTNISADDNNGCMPLAVDFSVGSNNVDSIITYDWTLPGSDIGTSIIESPSAIYNSNNCFDVDLIVTSVLGCTDTVSESNFICAGVAPIVDFDFTPLSTCFEVDDICFTFTGSGADTLMWDFDDGPIVWTGPSGAPCHAYTDDIGEYSPTLIAFNHGCPSDTLTFTDSIEILGPIAVFTTDFVSCSDWNTYAFNNNSVEADSSYWVFGDPSVPSGMDTSTLENPTWVYPTIDTFTSYTITLVVYNFTTGCDHTVTQNITVYPPHADFTYSDTIGCAPLTVSFENTSLDHNSNIWRTLWNWDDTYYFGPNNIGTVWTNSPNRSRTYSEPGIYTVIMRNTNDRGCWDTIRKPNLITVHGVTLNFDSDITEGCIPLTVNFYDSSSAPLTYVDSWHWDFGTGNLADTSNLQNPSFNYTEGGHYTVSLTVTDSFGCVNTYTLNNHIYVHEPLASFSLSDTFICNNQSVSITNSSVGDMLTYDWQFQNGSPAVFAPTGNPPLISYNVEGMQDIYLEVTDNLGCIDDTTLVLPVFDVVASGVADINYSACSNPPLLVNFSNTSYNNIDSSSVFWDFGNGVTSTDFEASTLYSTPGDYEVTLSINSLTGCSDTLIVDTVVVEGPWGVFEPIGLTDLCVCDSVIFEIKTSNAINPIFLTGDGQAIPFNPIGLLGDTIYDTLTVEYCNIGNYSPFLSFSQGTCSYNVEAAFSDSIRVDSLVSNFTFQNTVHCDTGTICFTDLYENEINGSANVNSWLWDFGDGNVSSLQHPCNFYNSPGVYEVCLTAGDTFGCQTTFCDSVIIRENPIVDFGLSDTSICIGDLVNFYDSLNLSNGAFVDSMFWNFGTGNILDTAVTSNPSFTYTNSGVYQVSLDVYDNFGCYNMDTLSNVVYDLPNVTTSSDTFVCVGDSVQINASGALSYTWLPNTDINNDTIFNPYSTTENDIQYFVTGIDSFGCVNVDSIAISVSDISADFSFSTPCVGDTVFFSDLSVNTNGISTGWEWNFDDLSSGLDSVSSIQNPMHVFNSSGNYDVFLEVSNDMFCMADTTIQVGVSISPEAIFESDSVCLGIPISFNSLLSTDGTGTIIHTSWDFGTGIMGDTSNLSSPSFTYSMPGLYTVCLRVISDLNCAGNFDDTCMTVQIYSPLTTAENIDTVCLGEANSFIDLSMMGDAPIVGEYWNFNQNIGDTIVIPGSNGDTSFTYNTFGSYSVTHIAMDANTCVDSSITTALVYDNPVADFSFSSSCINADNIFTSTSTNGLDGVNTINQFDWDIDEGSSFVTGSNVQTVDFNNLGMHAVSLAIIDNFGCTDTTTQNVNILVAPVAQIVLSDNEICEGESVNLDGSSSSYATVGILYAWDENYNTGIDNTIAAYNITPSANQQVMLVVTDDNSCVDTAFANITTHENPIASFTYENGCIGLPLAINSTSSSSDGNLTNFDWLVDNTATLSGSSSSYTPLTNNSFNLQLVVETEFNCIDSSSIVTVIVDTTVSINLSANDTIICAPDELSFEVTGSADNYIWTPQNLFIDNTSESVLANIQNTTTISVTGYSENNYCPEETETVEVIVANTPSIEYTATPNPIFIGLTSEIVLDVEPFNSSDSVIWDDNGTLNTNLGLYVDASPLEDTDYDFTVVYYYDSVRCVIDSFVNIQVLDECSNELIYAPNVFTPNNDTKNDNFGISGISVEYLNYLRIFDRWGKLMYEVENAEFKRGRMKIEDTWNGNNASGNYCNNGVYVIMYEAVCVNGSTIIGNGNVTLIR